MIRIIKKYNCCGCEACVQICPKHCISFNEDEEGFRYPLVNEIACINCGLCEKSCPVLNHHEKYRPLYLYAAKNNDESIRMSSSSGGVFSLLAEDCIRRNGVVFGARFNVNWEVEHGYTETIEGIAEFRTSKYVQSRIGHSFIDARDFLRQGRPVLFSGTSCQIAALRLFLNKAYDNLLTVDIICHGVPSPGVWRRYMDMMKRNALMDENSLSSPFTRNFSRRENLDERIRITNISFRDKRFGWNKYSFSLTLAKTASEGKQNTVSLSHIHKDDLYMKSFLSNINLRPSCYKCPAKGGKSSSDITLADFWGINKLLPDFDDDKGVSLVIINSKQGCDAYNKLKLISNEVSEKTSLLYNPSFYGSVSTHPNRDLFFRQVFHDNVDMEKLMISVSQVTFLQKIIKKIKKLKNRLYRKLRLLMG